MKLYCVRHGEALTADVDPECSLTEKGVADIAKVSKFLARYSLHVDHVMHSPKKRAVQTASILSKNIHCDVSTEESVLLTPDADVYEMVGRVNAWDQDTMIVSHLPFIGNLVSQLVTGTIEAMPIVNFTPGTIVCLHFYEQKRWMINWLLRPDLIVNG
jgi:phosphohistidine phosphatase